MICLEKFDIMLVAINLDIMTENHKYYIPFVFLVCNILVLTQIDPKVLHEIDHSCYHDFLVFSVVALAYFYIMLILIRLLGSQINENNTVCITNLIKLNYVIFLVSIVISLFYFMDKIWEQDSRHSVLIYRGFWSESAFNMSKNISNKWAYTMTDILIRIYSSIVIMFSIIILPLLGYLFYLSRYSLQMTPLTANTLTII